MQKPPKLFLRFFRWYCHPKLLRHIEGDLMELYRECLREQGKRKADRDFVIDVIFLFRPGIIRPSAEHSNIIIYSMYRSYLKTGWRNLVRNKAYSLINIGGLAAGMAVALLIGMWVYDEVSFDRYFQNYDRIVQVKQHLENNGETQTWTSMPYPLAEELRQNYGADFKYIVMSSNWSDAFLDFQGQQFTKRGIFFERDAPEMFTLNMLYGSREGLYDPASILLSASAAKSFFGDSNPVGKTMKLNKDLDVKVTGVYEDFPANTEFAGLEYMSTWELLYNNSGMKNMTDPWRPNSFLLYAQLNENADIDAASLRIRDAKLKKVNEQLAKKKPQLFLHPMQQWHLYSEFKNGVNIGGGIQYVWMFGAIGVSVLLLACINFMNLSTARSEKRAKEVGVRKAIGSRRGQLIIQFFSESILTVSFAFLLSLLLVQLAIPSFNEVTGKNMGILWNNPVFWIAAFCIVFITGFISGCYPALYLSSFKPIKVLKGVFSNRSAVPLPRRVLVVVQFCVSVALVIGTTTVYQQIQFAKSRPLGYNRDGLVTVKNSIAVHSHFDAMKEDLIKSGAVDVAATSESSLTEIWGGSSGFDWKGKDPDLSIDFGVIHIGGDYGKAIGWEIKAGRDFSREFPSDSTSFILNEAAVKFMGLKTPVGETVTWWGKPFTVIGVVKDVVMRSPYRGIGPAVYSLTPDPVHLVILKIKKDLDPKSALQKIEAVFKKYNPQDPFEYQFVDDEFDKKFAQEELTGRLVGFFATLAIAISCLGLFGLASFVTEQRTKEIGIRKVFGASVSALWKMLSKDFVLLVSIASFIAAPLAYYFISEWLQTYEYRMTLSWWVFILAVIGAVLITLLTVSFQAVRAAMANPVKSLRSE